MVQQATVTVGKAGKDGAPKRRRRRAIEPVAAPVASTPAPMPPPPAVAPVAAPGGPLGVVDQVRVAFSPEHRLAAAVGFLLAALVPVAVYTVAHHEVDPGQPLWAQPKVALVLGGLAFSAKTVYQWARQAFDDWVKAVGFVVLLEGIMVCSSTRWLALAALAYLVLINGAATGCQLTQKPKVNDSDPPW